MKRLEILTLASLGLLITVIIVVALVFLFQHDPVNTAKLRERQKRFASGIEVARPDRVAQVHDPEVFPFEVTRAQEFDLEHGRNWTLTHTHSDSEIINVLYTQGNDLNSGEGAVYCYQLRPGHTPYIDAVCGWRITYPVWLCGIDENHPRFLTGLKQGDRLFTSVIEMNVARGRLHHVSKLQTVFFKSSSWRMNRIYSLESGVCAADVRDNGSGASGIMCWNTQTRRSSLSVLPRSNVCHGECEHPPVMMFHGEVGHVCQCKLGVTQLLNPKHNVRVKWPEGAISCLGSPGQWMVFGSYGNVVMAPFRVSKGKIVMAWMCTSVQVPTWTVVASVITSHKLEHFHCSYSQHNVIVIFKIDGDISFRVLRTLSATGWSAPFFRLPVSLSKCKKYSQMAIIPTLGRSNVAVRWSAKQAQLGRTKCYL